MKQTKIEVLDGNEKPEAYPRDINYKASKVDGERVHPFKVTVRKDDEGFPSMVYVEGAHPFYPTWVYRENGFLLAYSPGLVSGRL